MNAPGRYWVIRHPSSGGPKSTVAQFDTQGVTMVPDEVATYTNWDIEVVDGPSNLVDNIDQSGLSEAEMELLRTVYPIIDG